MPPEIPLLILHELSGTLTLRLSMFFPAVASREGCLLKAKCACDIRVVSCKRPAGKEIKFLLRSVSVAWNSRHCFLFYEYQPRPYSLSLLSLALRIGAGIKRCHRGFTVDFYNHSRSLVLSEPQYQLNLTPRHDTALQLLRLKIQNLSKIFSPAKIGRIECSAPLLLTGLVFGSEPNFEKIRRVGRKKYSPLSPKRAWDRMAHGPGGWRSGSAAPLHGDGRGFESLIAHQPSFGAQRRTKAAASK